MLRALLVRRIAVEHVPALRPDMRDHLRDLALRVVARHEPQIEHGADHVQMRHQHGLCQIAGEFFFRLHALP